MAFQQGLSGLNAASKNLEVIGNNVANANTVGFKESRAQFADVYASSLAGAGSNTPGLGTRVQDIAQQFSQGNLNITNNALDVAVNGDGFFRLSNNGAALFSRNGEFHIDKNGYIANANNDHLTGYPVAASGAVLSTSAPQDLRVATADISPNTTSQAQVVSNFDSRKTALPLAGFNATDPSTYHNSTTVQIYDSLGNSHGLTTYFLKDATNRWQVMAENDGVAVGAGPIGAITFNSSGAIDTTATMLPFNLSLNMTGGATTPQAIALDFTTTTQFGAPYGVTTVNQNGYTSGRLLGFNIGDNGQIMGRYSNGQTRPQGQIVLASFVNPQGLVPVGNNNWSESAESGQPLVGAPQTGALGTLQSGALEESNVDLTAELVNMITAQRVYQANAQTIRTQDALLQTLVTLR